MILNSSQSIHTSRPLDTSSSRRVQNTSPAATSTPASDAEDKATEQAIRQQNETMLRELRARDREVRAHEAAHVSAGGSLVVSGPSFTYQQGPDGRSYAIGGSVQLDTSAVANDPEKTLEKADQVRQAALAPAQPSPQDLRVAANANQLAARARIDIAVQRREEAQLEKQQGALGEMQDTAEKQSAAENSASASGSQINESPIAAANAVSSSAQSKPVSVESPPVSVAINQFA